MVVDKRTPAAPWEPHGTHSSNAATPTPRPAVAVQITLPTSTGGGAGGATSSSPAGGPHGAAPTLADNNPIQVALPADPANAGKVDTVTLVIYGTRTVTQTVTVYSRSSGTVHATFAPAAFAAADARASSAGVSAPLAGAAGPAERRIPCAKGSPGCRPFTVVRHVRKTVALYRAKVSARADRAGRLHVAMPLHLAAKGAARVTLALTVRTPRGTATVRRAVIIAPRAQSRNHTSPARKHPAPTHKPAPHR